MTVARPSDVRNYDDLVPTISDSVLCLNMWKLGLTLGRGLETA